MSAPSPIDLHEVAPELRSATVVRELHRKLALMAAHVAEESVEVPDALAARVFAAEEEAALQLGKLDPTWEKRRQIAEDAWRDRLDDARGVRSDWAWPA